MNHTAQYIKNTNFWHKKSSLIRSDLLVTPQLIKLVGKCAGKKILDLGCGDGSITKYFANRKANIIGIDKNSELFLNNVKNAGRFIAGNITKLPFKDKDFDIVYSSMVFLHLNDTELLRVFKEIFRVLKKGGESIITDVHPFTLFSKTESKSVVHHNKNNNYFHTKEVGATIYNLNGDAFELNYYHRSLQTYIQSATNNGLVLVDCIEPKPTKVQLKKYQNLLSNETTCPSYILLKFKKN